MRLLSVLAALLLIGGLVGCDGDGTTTANDPNPDSFNTDSFAIVDSDDAFANLEDATLESEMAMKSAFHQGDGDFSRHHMHPRGSGSHLAPVLFRLGLDLDQLRQLRAIVREHRLSVHDSFEGLRDANIGLRASSSEARA